MDILWAYGSIIICAGIAVFLRVMSRELVCFRDFDSLSWLAKVACLMHLLLGLVLFGFCGYGVLSVLRASGMPIPWAIVPVFSVSFLLMYSYGLFFRTAGRHDEG